MATKVHDEGGGTRALSLDEICRLIREYVSQAVEQVFDRQGLSLVYGATLELLEKDWQEEVGVQKRFRMLPSGELRAAYARLAVAVSAKLPILFRVDDLLQQGKQAQTAPYQEDEFRVLVGLLTKWLSSLKAEPVAWDPSALLIRERFGFKAQFKAALDQARGCGIEVPLPS